MALIIAVWDMKRGGFIEVNPTISISAFGKLLVKTQLKESIPQKTSRKYIFEFLVYEYVGGPLPHYSFHITFAWIIPDTIYLKTRTMARINCCLTGEDDFELMKSV